MRSNRNSATSYDAKNILIIAGGIAGAFVLLLAITALKPFVIVDAGQRGVLKKFGAVQDTVLGEGLHPIVPIVYSVEKISVRVDKSDIPAQAASKDLQDVKMNVALNWSIDPQKVNEVYQSIGDSEQVVQRIIFPAVSEVVKAATAKKNAEEIITKRTELKDEIDRELQARLQDYGLIIRDISLVDVAFSPEFAKAIEAKQIAEQDAKRAVFRAQQAEQDAQAEINRARGQAEAQRLLRETITQEILQQAAIEKWNGQFPMVMGNDGALPFININPGTAGNRAPQGQ
ncbi:prohibitin family protein [Oxynema sp. CENA135]|uniref:Prohibitin family protein n=1 Tax=Oxynema aestuarii AP17 TaxID=2064643 RepID=A0A6H1TVI5_9CYAN|nr:MULTISPECIES: prohibitin family protein [Oxynema]MBK4732398.1 prohibitin family protein [Oxynema sp. CENA135]QIZ70602.1 prohibitin family protein [Oxynema aestuarii AP17]RMH78956.1 MAG: prohibitin family protein [Cyanobacteria bacterium J007]